MQTLFRTLIYLLTEFILPDTTYEILQEVKTKQAPGPASAKANAGPTRAEMNQAARIMTNMSSIVDKNMGDEDDAASHHSREDEHHYINDDDNDHRDDSNFDPTNAFNRAAASYIAAHAPPARNASSSGNSKPTSSTTSSSKSANTSQKDAMKNVNTAKQAISSAKTFLTNQGLKFW